MQNGDGASPSISLAGRALLIKMFIALEPRSSFLFKFCILLYFNIVQQLVCEPVTRLHPAPSWPVMLFCENAQNSWISWYMLIKFCMLCILKPVVCKTVTRFHRANILAGRALLMKIPISVPLGKFCSKFVYLFIFTLSSNWYAKR